MAQGVEDLGVSGDSRRPASTPVTQGSVKVRGSVPGGSFRAKAGSP